jgi:hypoxanthine phosphoribosyltransferase
MALKPAHEALQSADRLYDTAAIDAALDRMADEMSRTLATVNPLWITIMNGGLHTSAALTMRLKFPVEMDYCHATRYRGETAGGNLLWRAMPATTLRDRVVVLCDDILDEGKTLAAIRRYALAQGASKVLIAVLTKKLHDRCVPDLVADFQGLTVPDRYVFGYGMDYSGSLRNLPAIYAL